MRRAQQVLALGIVAASTVAGVGVAGARSGDIRVAGVCSGSSTSKLKLAPRPSDRQTRVEFEVDQNVANQTWHVTISDNGAVVVNRDAVTNTTSGSFTVATRRPGASGHQVLATASNPKTGESCTASAQV